MRKDFHARREVIRRFSVLSSSGSKNQNVQNGNLKLVFELALARLALVLIRGLLPSLPARSANPVAELQLALCHGLIVKFKGLTASELADHIGPDKRTCEGLQMYKEIWCHQERNNFDLEAGVTITPVNLITVIMGDSTMWAEGAKFLRGAGETQPPGAGETQPPTTRKR
ncbi:hypothetical protein JTB14_016466 [Gonioctena quinquepunctata]|nr:hypothetical protein JTB14_016466 [Gonioctena quinquepunctata]